MQVFSFNLADFSFQQHVGWCEFLDIILIKACSYIVVDFSFEA